MGRHQDFTDTQTGHGQKRLGTTDLNNGFRMFEFLFLLNMTPVLMVKVLTAILRLKYRKSSIIRLCIIFISNHVIRRVVYYTKVLFNNVKQTFSIVVY